MFKKKTKQNKTKKKTKTKTRVVQTIDIFEDSSLNKILSKLYSNHQTISSFISVISNFSWKKKTVTHNFFTTPHSKEMYSPLVEEEQKRKYNVYQSIRYM